MPSLKSAVYVALGAFAASSTATCTYSNAPSDPTVHCNDPGVLKNAVPLRKFNSKSKDYTFCRDTCFGDDTCKSFSYNASINRCALYTSRVIDQSFTRDTSSKVNFWARKCFVQTCVTDTPTSTSTPDPTDTITSTPTDETGPYPTPDNPDDFTNTYTYTEGYLPTFTDAPATLQGVPTDVPAPRCFLDATDPTAKFEIVNGSGIPLVYQTGKPARLGLLRMDQMPQSAQGLKDYKYPQFHFEKPSKAPAGYYDLVIEDPTNGPLYLAREGYGSIYLVNKSSNGQTPRLINNQWLTTTIWGVSCEGKMAAGTTSQTFVWGPSGKYTSAVPGTPDDSKAFLIIPAAIRNGGKSKLSKRNVYQDGIAPRCINKPRPLFADVKKDARAPHANGCGSDSTKSFVPDLDFGTCCNNHDYCYDNCKNGFKDQCDNTFQDCMHGSCDADFGSWWEWPLNVGCKKIADFYHWSVASFATGAFYDANKERCQCFCQDAGTQLCSVGGGDPQCLQVKGSDNNNCGACGQQCPTAFSHCSSGACVCNQDTCAGGLCLSLQDNPRNCGACGNVCDSRACYKGHCYTPPPPSPKQCTPMDSIVNGGFDTWGVDPFYVSFPPNTYSNNRVDSDEGQGPDLYMLSGVGGPVTVQQDVFVCPGTNYRLTFTSFSYASCSVSAWLGGLQMMSGQGVKRRSGDRDSKGGNGQVTVYVDPGYADNNGFKKWGATFNTTLTITFSCSGYASIWMDEVSLYPV